VTGRAISGSDARHLDGLREQATVNLPVHLCVDVEPDAREVAGDPAADWSATEPCIELLEEFRAKAQRSGRPVHINWFLRLDPQITEAYGRADYAFERYRAVWERVLAAGDGIGIHVHAWRRHGDGWSTEHGDADWVVRCVSEGLDAFERCTGRRAPMFRFGDRFQSDRVMRLLEERGVEFDLTLEPGLPAEAAVRHEGRASGGLPDYRKVPRAPYFPSRFDYRRRARWFAPRDVRIVPVSTASTGDDVLSRRGGQFIHLNLANESVSARRLCEGLLASPQTTHLTWVARTGDFSYPRYAPNYRANLDYLAGRGLRFVRPDEAWSSVPR
jgi:hypothetical protein